MLAILSIITLVSAGFFKRKSDPKLKYYLGQVRRNGKPVCSGFFDASGEFTFLASCASEPKGLRVFKAEANGRHSSEAMGPFMKYDIAYPNGFTYSFFGVETGLVGTGLAPLMLASTDIMDDEADNNFAVLHFRGKHAKESQFRQVPLENCFSDFQRGQQNSRVKYNQYAISYFCAKGEKLVATDEGAPAFVQYSGTTALAGIYLHLNSEYRHFLKMIN